MNTEIATKLIRLAIYALKDAHPSVPQRGEPLASVLRSRKLNPKVERERLRKHGKWLQRCHIRTVVRGKYSDSEGSSESDGEEFSGSDEYESSSEGSIAYHTQVKQSAPSGGGIGRVFVSRVAFFGVYFF